MQCPVCENVPLTTGVLEGNLPCRTCPQCGGCWIEQEWYDAWWAKTELRKPEVHGEQVFSAHDIDAVVPCTACSGNLLKYKVGFDCQFSVNRCFNCKGIWLDAGEWEALQSRNFHDDLEMIFSQEWQARITQHESTVMMNKRLEQRLGEDFAKVHEVIDWLNGHIDKGILLRMINEQTQYNTPSQS